MFKCVWTYTHCAGVAHVSVNKLIVGDYCICVHEPAFVRANKNELRTKDLPLVSTVSCVRGCVSVFTTFGSVLSVGDGILFVLVMSAAARSHGPAWTQGGSVFDSCSLAASVNGITRPQYSMNYDFLCIMLALDL